MTDVLAGIVERKREEVTDRLRGWPVQASPTTRSLKAALGRPGARFIMEVKRKSPSGHRSRLGLAEAVTAYAPVADAISVQPDGEHFCGSLPELAIVRAAFDGPI
jgi:indole-3-glycerol phosphate synthase/phosphoribosylanthranilate isomerase